MPCETCGATLDEFLCGNVGLSEMCDDCAAACGDLVEVE